LGTEKEKENREVEATESEKEMKAERWACAMKIRKIGEISVQKAGLTIERWRDVVQSLFLMHWVLHVEKMA